MYICFILGFLLCCSSCAVVCKEGRLANPGSRPKCKTGLRYNFFMASFLSESFLRFCMALCLCICIPHACGGYTDRGPSKNGGIVPKRALHEESWSQGLEEDFSVTQRTTFTSALPFPLCFPIFRFFWRKRGPRIFAGKWPILGGSDVPPAPGRDLFLYVRSTMHNACRICMHITGCCSIR